MMRTYGSPATAFRISLLVLCSVLSVVADARSFAALPIALLAAFAVLFERRDLLRRHQVAACLVEASFTGLAIAVTGGAESPMLPYVLAPMLALGVFHEIRHVVAATVTTTLGLAVGRLAVSPNDPFPQGGSLPEFVTASGQWLALGLSVGVVAAWAKSLPVDAPVVSDRHYAEARELLEQLHRVTGDLAGGLDIASLAGGLLDRAAEIAPSARSAALVRPESGALITAAVRGTTRVPWRAPLSAPGPLQDAWESRAPVVDRRPPDSAGRRVGSCVLALPLLAGAEPFGLLILEAFDQDAFPDQVVSELVRLAAAWALRLETSLLFEEVRSSVTLQERGRLAREMHDGVAQELAYVGYELDALRSRAAKVDGELEVRLAEVRTSLTRMISDIRMSITGLRTSVSNDNGLGAALSDYVRAVGSGQRMATHITLQESAFRLNGETEVLLLQITQAVAQDARKTGQADNLWVTLTVDPPSAHLCVEHDRMIDSSSKLDLTRFATRLAQAEAYLVVLPRVGGGVVVEVRI